jgi:hypothetical protein
MQRQNFTARPMKQALCEAGLDLADELHEAGTYRLEVKTTLGICGDLFHVSQNQVDMTSLCLPAGPLLVWLTSSKVRR